MKIKNFKIRASYPNFFMLNLYMEQNRSIFEKENEREGNKPGTVIYQFEDDDNLYEIAPKWYDIYYLLTKNNEDDIKQFLTLLIEEHNGDNTHHLELETLRESLYQDCVKYISDNYLYEDEKIVTTVTPYDFSEVAISNKGKMLLELTKQCYAVPDFCIISSNAFLDDDQEELLRKAIHNLEVMTKCKFGSEENPLVFALRSAMPQYIPGLMPTLLNIGINRKAYRGLSKKYGTSMGNRIYLSTLSNMIEMLAIDYHYTDENDLSVEEQLDKIKMMENLVIEKEGNDRLLEDAFYQAIRFHSYVRNFYIKNQDLVLTFMRGKKAYPSMILHKMVWTIGNENSYPGVLYSCHSRTGVGRQIESYPDIFGEEIMTGHISSEDFEYFDRAEIKELFPAVYHFDPLLINLEKRFQSPVTIEFAVETQSLKDSDAKSSLFAVLQLNKSELTGRAALLSAIELYEKGFIDKEVIIDLVRPYHLRQIFSDTIDKESFNQLRFFCNGVNVLPRTAVSARLCFSVASANKMKSQGYNVCLCRERFTPEDTIVLNEVDSILSMTPAAIHVVTACRGYGIPAFLDLSLYGVKIIDNKLVNNEGMTISEHDWITVSSKKHCIYSGKANFTPARFRQYLDDDNFTFTDEKEEKVFTRLKPAYEKYQQIINSTKVNYINDINSLARIISYDLNQDPEKAAIIVNTWYNLNSALYQNQVLESKMGSHNEQSRVFNLLDIDKKIDFFKNIIIKCIKENLSGLEAGSFMLGRFLAKPLPKSFWEAFLPNEIAFMLNEYVLYEKYLTVLQEVGETKLTRTSSKIISEGLHELEIKNFDYYTFIPLMNLKINWSNVVRNINLLSNKQDNTLIFIETLSKPISDVFNMDQYWVRSKVEKLINF
ncbi:MAG: hypothetical protein II981_10990 [Bacteroidales bacterium]|nr:hypothetical protein [Bacteroidales bacterium]